MKTIAQLVPGEMATVIAEGRSTKLSGFRRRSLGLSKSASPIPPAPFCSGGQSGCAINTYDFVFFAFANTPHPSVAAARPNSPPAEFPVVDVFGGD
jgi:hypothetical protein